MTEAAACCQAIDMPTPSPFEVIQLDYADGIAAGLARCRVCRRCYRFDTLTTSPMCLRVYGFAQIAEAYFDGVAAASEPAPASLTELPTWLARLAVVESRLMAHQADRDLLVLATDPSAEILRSRKVDHRALVEFVRASS